MSASEINHYKVNKAEVRKALLIKLKSLGFNYEPHSFGITVLNGGKIVFHGREYEVEKWLIERGNN